jgi:hypothetical protein
VVLLPLWNYATAAFTSDADIRARYEYWLKFITSVADIRGSAASDTGDSGG